jgi:ubiquinone/menaquinone biosynthesis C-methylase UbiE
MPHPDSKTNPILQALMVISMTVGRRRAAEEVATIAMITAGDRLVDVGCGPGTAVREAARRGATATGIDPVPAMLKLARWISSRRHAERVTWLEGRAEELPIPDGEATVVWALSSFHHWGDEAAGMREARRVLAPDGRLVIAERLARSGGGARAAHGLTRDRAEELARTLATTGFADVRTQEARAGRRHLIVVQAQMAPSAR